MKRVITRRIPGFTWVQFGISREREWGSWWSVRGIARTHAFGYFRVLTMRKDCLARAKRAGLFRGEDS